MWSAGWTLPTPGLECLPENQDTDGNNGVGHQRSDGHHVDEVLQLEERSHDAAKQAG